ncbi:glycosyltransferase family 4 protein, partial [Patescibacteria group bacterium]|nr:glycosyltransferase family 4 protein [Patescibacteria group bacterium]
MNIALFTFAYNPFEGGAEVAAREIVNRLKQRDFTIFTYKFNRKWLSSEKGVNYELVRLGKGVSVKEGDNGTQKYYGRIWSKIYYIYKAWQEAEKRHQQKRFNVIWALMASYGGVAALLFKLNHPKIPLLLTLQEGDSEKYLIFGKLGLVGWFGKKIIKKADMIQCISHYLADFAKKRGAKCPIEVVPNGVDIEIFQNKYSNLEIKAIRDNLELKDDYIVLTTSRLVYKNGMDILIEAIAKLKEKKSNIKLLIIGDGPELKNLRQTTNNLQLKNNVSFLGHIPQKDLPLYFRVADVFARPSRSEGLGNSFLEAMAAGIPTIGTSVGGIVDFLIDNKTGFISKVEAPNDLAEKIDYVLTHFDER